MQAKSFKPRPLEQPVGTPLERLPLERLDGAKFFGYVTYYEYECA